MIKSSIIGWFTGLLPGLSYVLSATIAYNWQKNVQIKKGTYQVGNMPSLVSAETSNTAGAVSTLIPLIVFGIPITWSETIVYNLMSLGGADFSRGGFLIVHGEYIVTAFIIANLIGLICCWPLSDMISRLLSRTNFVFLWLTIIVLVIVSVLYVGWYNNMLMIYVVIFALMTMLGISMKKYIDPIPLVFVFLMQNSIDQSVFNFIQFNF